jgi:hypothetical protein
MKEGQGPDSLNLETIGPRSTIPGSAGRSFQPKLAIYRRKKCRLLDYYAYTLCILLFLWLVVVSVLKCIMVDEQTM